jgi:hypothetical protein
MIRSIFLLLACVVFTGCGPKIEIMTEPMSISGKLTGAGAPVGGVLLTLQPLDTGHPVPLTVGPDGSFSGRAIPGKYTYYVAATEANATALDKVDAKYKEADLKRTIVIKSDSTTYDIALD